MTAEDRLALDEDVSRAEAPGGVPVLKAYQDTKGIWTIGFGTNLQQLTITPAIAQAWKDQKLQEAEAECKRAFAWYAALSSARQRAMIELVYNMGLPTVLQFKNFLQAMSENDYEWAKTELLDSKWRTDVGPTRSGRIANLILNG